MTPLSFFIAFGATLYLLLVLRRIAPRLGLLDQPGGRKAHKGAIPLVGGLAMFVGFAFALLMLDTGLHTLRALIAGATLMVVVGVLDDMHELSSSSRFIVQIASALMMIYWGGVELLDLGKLVSDETLYLGWWSVPLTVFATVGVINALNMVDGVDGLAGSVALVSSLALALAAVVNGNETAALVLGLLASVLAAFLLLNLRLPWQPRATVFMGDAGSMFLGFVLAWFLIDLAQGEGRAISPAAALWLLGVPLIDTVTMMLRRILKKRSPFAPDREHFHHVLLLAGFSPSIALAIIVGASLGMAAFGLAAHWMHLSEAVIFYLFLGLFVAYFWMIRRSWKVLRFLRRSIDRRRQQQPFEGDDRRQH